MTPEIEHLNARLDRIEGHLVKMTDAISSLARAEEKLIHVSERIVHLSSAVDDLDGRVSTIELSNAGSKWIHQLVEKAVLVVIAIGMAALFGSGLW